MMRNVKRFRDRLLGLYSGEAVPIALPGPRTPKRVTVWRQFPYDSDSGQRVEHRIPL